MLASLEPFLRMMMRVDGGACSPSVSGGGDLVVAAAFHVASEPSS
jgi:hypothetical protein